jgi:hypothetical protein
MTVATTGATELNVLFTGAGGAGGTGVGRVTSLAAFGRTMASGRAGDGAGNGVGSPGPGWAIFRSTKRRAG